MNIKKLLFSLLFLTLTTIGWGQASLPVNRTIWDSTPIGWTDNPLDSYTTIFACSGSNGAKFDTNGDNKILNFTGTPSELTFVVKSNTSNSTSVLLIEESTDGLTFSTVVSLTGNSGLPTTCTTKGPYALNSNTRYIKWTFTKGTSNMTMDDVYISASPTVPTLSISGTLNEGTLNTATVGLTLANDTFADGTLSAANFTLNNAPAGVSIAGVAYNSSTTATVTLAYDNTDFDANVTNFNITVAGTELTSAANLTSNNLTITALTETLTLSSGTLAFGTVCNGSTSSEQTFTVSGTNLKSGNISLAALTGYAYSLTTGGPYTSTLSFSQPGGTLAAKTIYVILTSVAANQTYNGNIAVSGGAAPSVNKAVTGNSTVVSPAVVTNTVTTVGTTTATLRATSSTFGVCPNTTEKGFVYAVNSINATPTNGGTGVITSPNSTLGTQGSFTQGITGLAEGTTYAYQAYLFDDTTYTYGGVQTFQTTVTSASNVTNAKACLTDTGGTISWDAPTTAPYGYMLFAVAATTAGTGTPTTPIGDYATVNPDYSLATTYGTLGKLLYKGSATSVAISGLTEDTVYSFRVFSYNQGAEIRSFSNGTTAGSKAENIAAQDDVKTFTGTPSNNQVTLNWTYNSVTSCFDEVLIVANQGAVTFTPSGDGSAYTADDTWNNAGDQVVYKGTATSKAVYDLTNGTQYCFKIFVRRGTTWSDGVSVCATPDITYCTSSGDTSNSGITNVTFNTINNSTSSNVGYSDFTSISTDVILGSQYALSVSVNTNGGYTSYTKVWVDWNRDGDFNDSNESYELGTATTNGQTSNSPLNITIPTSATLGNVRMRVSSNTNNSIGGYTTSCQTFTYGEVEDYTLNITESTAQEINVTGAGISIPDGFNAPYGLNNTLFAGTVLGNQSIEKEFIVENLGLTTLNLTGTPVIQLIGANPGDFVITQQAASSVAAHGTSSFKIKFVPTASGTRTATVLINNDDANESTYEFKIQGTGDCPTYTNTFLPTTGPVNTEVNVTSSADLTGAIISFNGNTLSPLASTVSSMTFKIPVMATSGYITITLANGCTISQYFNVISSDDTTCATIGSSGNASELFISQVTDSGTDAMTYIELYNNTGSTVNINNYSIRIYNNGVSGATNTIDLNNVNVLNGNTFVVVVGSDSPSCTSVTGGSGELADQTEGSLSGVNFESNKNDYIALYNGTTKVDSWGVYQSTDWADGLGLGSKGANFERKNTVTAPNTTFTTTDWDISDWDDTCDTVDYSGIGHYSSLQTVLPIINSQSISQSTCDDISITVSASEGVEDSTNLAYQWYVLPSGSGTWTAISDTGVYSGSNSNTLSISSITGLNNYQFYCQVREDDVTCFIASEATIVRGSTTWTSTGWSNFEPDLTRSAIIDYNYNTSTNGDFNACSLVINENKTLTVGNSGYCVIKNSIDNNGQIIVENTGSLVQVNETDTNTGAGIYKINKTTGSYYNYDYFYWASPVENETVGSVLSSVNYKYTFNPANYLDVAKGHGYPQPDSSAGDGYDDNGDDWSFMTNSANMPKGLGFIAMGVASPSSFSVAQMGIAQPAFDVTFEGDKINNATFTAPVYQDAYTPGFNADNNNLNLLGNPYPSAIDVYELYHENESVLEGKFYFWTHDAQLTNLGGPNTYDFNNNNFAVGTITGTYPSYTYTVTVSGTGKQAPRYIASTQGFMASAIDGISSPSNISYKNAMRVAGNNNTFLRQANLQSTARIWLNMTGENNFNQIAIGFDTTTSDLYGMGDAPRIDSANDTDFYSLINDDKGHYAIQFLSEFNDNKTVPLGIEIRSSGTYQINIDHFDGVFAEGQPIYLEDTYENIIHDFANGAYPFTQNAGTNINDRFVVRFTSKALNLEDNLLQNLTLYPNPSKGMFYINYTGTETLEIEVFDVLGKKVLQRTNPNTLDLSNYNSGIYLAKFTTPSGNVTKKLVRE